MTKRGKNRWRVPGKVRVKDTDYKIAPCTGHFATRHSLMGQICYSDDEILFSEKMDKFETADTVLHEILHALGEEFSIKFGHSKREEAIVNKLSTGLIETFRGNQQLLEWFYKILKKNDPE